MDGWTLNVDGASKQSGPGIDLQLRTPSGEKIEQSILLGFNASNNESEYEAILAGLELAAAVSTDRLLIRSDSELVVGQVNEEFEFPDWKLEHIPRDYNEKANALASVPPSLTITETIFCLFTISQVH